MRERWATPAIIVGAALLGALLEAGQVYLGNASLGRPIAWSNALVRTLPSWLLLAALTPGILWVADHFRLERPMLHRSIPVHAVAAVLFTLLHLGGTVVMGAIRTGDYGFMTIGLRKMMTTYFALDVISYAAIVGARHALRYRREARQRELAASRLEASLTEAKLQALRGQLNPHFLFNTLNAISVMALKGEQENVVQMLGSLSDLLRVSIDERMPQEVPLADELDFLDRYLEIQRIRFADRLTVRREIDPSALDAMVPSMLLQPIVENAMVHGITPTRGPGELGLRVVRENGTLTLEVSDTGPGFTTPNAAPGERGIGLSNTRQRLEQMYGARYALTLGRATGGGGLVTISIPLRRAGSAVDG